MRLTRLLIPMGIILFILNTPVAAGLQAPEVEGDTFSATIQLTPGISADLTIRFENSIGLGVDSLGVSVDTLNLLDPLSLPGLDGEALEVPSAFPVELTIAPPQDGGFAFEGLAEVEIYTHNLQYSVGTPFRIFAASPGEAFRDITAAVSGGSYRTRGSTGTFSRFVIVADTRPLPDVINAKFDAAEARLDGFSSQMSGSLYNQLQSALQSARSAWNSGDTVAAVSAVESFEQIAHDAGGTGLPDVWRSSRDIDNVSGELRERATSLRFSLVQAINFL